MAHLRFGISSAADKAMANRICCRNHRWAEPAGYFHAKKLFTDVPALLNPDGDNVFYDSVCGKPLFVAPRGRSFAAWRQETEEHGWPSFRKEELIAENVNIHKSGRISSVCGTHLGHDLPDGRERYCIDLVCIAGFASGTR